jgi:hypothetical protein
VGEASVGALKTISTRATESGSSRSNVVAILPRGEAIRNFVYSGALDELKEEADVHVLSIVPGKEFRNLLAGRYGAFYDLEDYPERWIVNFTREILDIAHGRCLWSKAARYRWNVRDHEAASLPSSLKRRIKKLLCYPFANQTGLRYLANWERGLSRWLRTTEEFVRLFERLQPSLVFNGSHVHSRVAVQAVQAAQWLGIPTATFLFSWDNLTSQGRIIPLYDHYLVWNDSIQRDLHRIYPSISSSQVSVVGTPQFDFHFRSDYYWTREEFCARIGADPRRPIILYSSGMANHMPGEPEIAEQIADLIAGWTEFGPPQLLVRVYPKDQTGRFETLRKRRSDMLIPEIPWEAAWLTPKPEDLPLLTNTLRHCATGINIASTISLELCMFDKPVINIGYDAPGRKDPFPLSRFYQFDHYEPVVRSGAVQVAYSFEELEKLLKSALARPEERSNQRRALVQTMFGNTLDGRSSTRVAEALLRCVQSRSRQ